MMQMNIAVKSHFERRFYNVESNSEAERIIGSRHIVDVLKGKRNHVKGWRFRYAEEVMPNGNQDSFAISKAKTILDGQA